MRKCDNLHFAAAEALLISIHIEGRILMKRDIFYESTRLFGLFEPRQNIRRVFDQTGEDNISLVQELLSEVDGYGIDGRSCTVGIDDAFLSFRIDKMRDLLSDFVVFFRYLEGDVIIAPVNV